MFLRAEATLTCPRSSHTPPRVPHARHPHINTPPTAQRPTPPRGRVQVSGRGSSGWVSVILVIYDGYGFAGFLAVGVDEDDVEAAFDDVAFVI